MEIGMTKPNQGRAQQNLLPARGGVIDVLDR
jgi:hypothetical protein